MNILITFPDQSVKSFNGGISPLEIAETISKKLAQNLIVAEVNGKLVDPNFRLNEDSTIFLHTFSSTQGKDVFWHSSAHLMALAVKELYPEVKVTIGPSIENGFYYDFDKEEAFTDDDLLAIEHRMMELAKQNHSYQRQVISRLEGLKLFTTQNEKYKIELIEAIPENETITLYTLKDFIDLCRGPHLPNTCLIKAVKLLKTSGAYWRGDEKNKMLKRIYGISFPTVRELNDYLCMLEEAKKRDHRKLGKELDLYSISDEVGAGLILWHPKGALIRHLIESFWKEQHLQAGYNLVYTPHIGKDELWNTSGHSGFYSDSMYKPIEVDDQHFYIKPMNCPFHISIYQSSKRSYRELPIKYAELGTVYRYERSGTLHGLMRVRGFTQDDAHIFCTKEQMPDEVEKTINFSITMLKNFGFTDFQIFLSTKPEKFVGEQKDWDDATLSLKTALEKMQLPYEVDEGGGAFYGPKIDIKIKDALNRAWQCSTIQFDFNMSTRFNIEYTGSDNQPHRPYMIHRALLGSVERFFGTLIEHFSGNFPLWLSPVQAIILTISDLSTEYAERIYQQFSAKGIRLELDVRNEKISYKIREAEMAKIPFILIVGEKENNTNSLSVRRHTKGDLGSHSIESVLEMIKEECKNNL